MMPRLVGTGASAYPGDGRSPRAQLLLFGTPVVAEVDRVGWRVDGVVETSGRANKCRLLKLFSRKAWAAWGLMQGRSTSFQLANAHWSLVAGLV